MDFSPLHGVRNDTIESGSPPDIISSEARNPCDAALDSHNSGIECKPHCHISAPVSRMICEIGYPFLPMTQYKQHMESNSDIKILARVACLGAAAQTGIMARLE